MVILSDIASRSDIKKGFEDADIDMLIIGYTKKELENIILEKTTYNMLILFINDILTIGELKKYGKELMFYGLNKKEFINGLVDGTKLELLADARALSKHYKYDFQINNAIYIMTKLDIRIDDLNTLLDTGNLFGEVCYALIYDNINLLRSVLSKHMYIFNPDYIRKNINLFRYLSNVPYNGTRKIKYPCIHNQEYISEIDMMKSIYGIPFINCTTNQIQTCYKKIVDGGLTLTLLIDGSIEGTSEITFDDYNSNDIIFLLWNKSMYRAYSIDDILSCISIEDRTIRMVDPNGNIIEDTKYLCEIIRSRLKPYINIGSTKLDIKNVLPKIISILDVVEHIINIKSIPQSLIEYVNNNRDKCKEYIMDMYHMALYFRRWKGPGHPIPYKRKDADDKSVNPEVLCATLINKYRMLLKSGAILPFLKVCPAYKDTTLVPQYSSIQKLFRSTINGEECIRIASSRFLYTSHRLYTTLYEKLDSNIESFEPIRLLAPEEQ